MLERSAPQRAVLVQWRWRQISVPMHLVARSRPKTHGSIGAGPAVGGVFATILILMGLSTLNDGGTAPPPPPRT